VVTAATGKVFLTHDIAKKPETRAVPRVPAYLTLDVWLNSYKEERKKKEWGR
jgi:hypothetical protein